jgi:hypothetical protein
LPRYAEIYQPNSGSSASGPRKFPTTTDPIE